MSQYDILLVEDDDALAFVTRDALEDEGYLLYLVNSIQKAELAIYEHSFKMIVLDINLPDDTGFALCERIRSLHDVPILFVSARTSIDDRLHALSIGGDDYLAKPYVLRELVARVHAHMRRNYQFLPNMKQHTGPFHIDFQNHTVEKQNQTISLSEKEFEVLSYLMKHANQCISKDVLFASIWGQSSEAQNATIPVHIRWLREKLEDDPSQPHFLKTVWGRGYMWEDKQ